MTWNPNTGQFGGSLDTGVSSVNPFGKTGHQGIPDSTDKDICQKTHSDYRTWKYAIVPS